MKSPRRFRIVLTGDTLTITKRNNTDHGKQLGYIMNRLLSGEEIADSVFKPFGLTVEVEEDMDQGD